MLKNFVATMGYENILTPFFFTRRRREAGMEEFERVCCFRGYHVYKEIWEVATREILICERELHNGRDRYAVAVKKSGTIIGHLPRKLSRVCSLFLR